MDVSHDNYLLSQSLDDIDFWRVRVERLRVLAHRLKQSVPALQRLLIRASNDPNDKGIAVRIRKQMLASGGRLELSYA